MKVMRNGSIIDVEAMEPGDISILLFNGTPVGHVAIITEEMAEQFEKERAAMGIVAKDDDIDWDDEYEDY